MYYTARKPEGPTRLYRIDLERLSRELLDMDDVIRQPLDMIDEYLQKGIMREAWEASAG